MNSGARFEPGSEFAGYRIEAFVRRTGAGETYRATQIALDRAVVLDVVGPELARDEGFRSRFLESARVAASIKHPNVAPVHEVGEERDHLFLCSAYVNSKSLGEIVDQDGAMDSARAARIVAQVADGLEAAHTRGLVHGDLTPASVLVERHPDHDHVYITGLGVAQPQAVSTAEDVDALVRLLKTSLGGAGERDFAKLLTHGYPSAGAFGRAALSLTEVVEVLPTHRRSHLRRVGLALITVILGLGVAIGLLASLGAFSDSGSRVAGTIVGEPISVGPEPFELASANGSVWVRKFAEHENLLRIDPNRNEVVGLPFSLEASEASSGDIAVGRNAILALNVDGSMTRIDLRTRGRVGKHFLAPKAYSLVSYGGSVWVSSSPTREGQQFTVARFDAVSGRRLGAPTPVGYVAPLEIVFGHGSAWVLPQDPGFIRRIHLTTGDVVARFAIEHSAFGIASGAGAIWALAGPPSTLIRIDPLTDSVAWTRSLAEDVRDMEFLQDSLWVLSSTDVHRFDTVSGLRLGEPIPLPAGEYAQIVAAGGALWLADHDAGTVTRINPSNVAPEPVPVEATRDVPGSFRTEGPLQPGRYTTDVFTFPLSLRLGKGWSLRGAESASSLNLSRSADRRTALYFMAVTDVFSPAGDETRPVPPDMVQWLRNHPYVDVSRSRKTVVGGQPTVIVDVAVPSTPKPNPPECMGEPCVLIFRIDVNLEYALVPRERDRFIFVDTGDETLVVLIATTGTSAKEFEGFARKAEQVLATLELR
jgi:serine/threonine protein kinase